MANAYKYKGPIKGQNCVGPDPTGPDPTPDPSGEGTMDFIMVIEKLQVHPERKWILHNERKVVGRITPKRIYITEGIDKGKVFDRATGAEIRREYGSWYRHSLRHPAPG